MRLLAVSDKTAPTLLALHNPPPVDMLLGCGDLPYSYMEYLVTRLRVRDALYVHGNHDAQEFLHSGEVLDFPGGWQNLDQRVAIVQGLIIAGLEGSIRYKPKSPFQYTEYEMRKRAQKLILRLLWAKVRFGRDPDIVITHAPPLGIHDGPDAPHQGFRIFLNLMRQFHPRLWLHGHKHRYGPSVWRTHYVRTEVINVYPYRWITLQDQQFTISPQH